MASPYLLKFRRGLVGNTIESRDMEDVRHDVVTDIRRVTADIASHDSEIHDLHELADNTMLLPNGVWTNGTPDGLRQQAIGLEGHYDRVDHQTKRALFENIYDADMEIAKSGVYEKQGQSVLGRADLVNESLADTLTDAFGTEYDDYAVGRLQIEEQINIANEDVEGYLQSLAEQHNGRIPVYTPGVYVPVRPETLLDTMPQERQDHLRKVAKEAGLKGMREGKVRKQPDGYVDMSDSSDFHNQYQ